MVFNAFKENRTEAQGTLSSDTLGSGPALTVHECLHCLVHVEVELLQHQDDLVVAFVGNDRADCIDL